MFFDDQNIVSGTNGNILTAMPPGVGQQAQQSVLGGLSQPSIAQQFQVAGDVVPFPHEMARAPSGDPVGPTPGPSNVLQIDPLAGGVPQGVGAARGRRPQEDEVMLKAGERRGKLGKAFRAVREAWLAKNAEEIQKLRASLPAGYEEPSIAGEVAKGVMSGKVKVAPRPEASTQDVYHGSKAAGFGQFKVPDPADEFMIDRAIGVHVSKDPAIAQTFTDVRGDMGPASAGGMYPLRIPDDSKFLEVNQPLLPYVAPGTPKGARNVHTDQTQIGNLVYKTAFQQDPPMFARYLQSRWRMTESEAKAAARDILKGRPWDAGYRQIVGLDDYEKFEGVMSMYGDSFKADRGRAVQLFKDEMKRQGYVGLKYINTSPMETAGATDPTSYVIFDPRNIRSKFTPERNE